MNSMSFRLRSLMGIGLMLLMYPLSSSAQNVQAEVTLDIVGDIWTYTVSNREPATSNYWLSGFFLPIFAPVTNIVAPSPWTVDTDALTFVNWQNNQDPAPFLNDIPPGGSLQFQFESAAAPVLAEYELFSFDHNISDLGPNGFGPILVPGIQAVPEGSTLLTLSAALTLSAGLVKRRKRVARHECESKTSVE
jgi:hypothetical protein